MTFSEEIKLFKEYAYDSTSNVVYGLLDKNDNFFYREACTCFNGLKIHPERFYEYRQKKIKLNKIIIDHRTCNIFVTKDDALIYINWLVNESPYSEVFISKDPHWIYDNVWIVDPHFPANVVVGACILTRFTSETWESTKGMAKLMMHLIKLGVDPNLSHIFSYLFKSYADKIKEVFPVYSHKQPDHVAIYPWKCGKDFILNFINNNRLLEDNNYNEILNYKGSDLYEIWGREVIEDERMLTWALKVDCVKSKKFDLNIFRELKTKGEYSGKIIINNDEELLLLVDEFKKYVGIGVENLRKVA